MRKISSPRPGSDRRVNAGAVDDFFGAGIITDGSASKLPSNALADGFNIVVHPTEIYGREGSQEYTSTSLPALGGRTGYSASKSGYVVTLVSGTISEDDVGDYFVFPGADPVHCEILEYLKASSFRTSFSSDIALTVGCAIRGKNNLWRFHKILRKWIWQLGQKLYIQDLQMSRWTEAICISRDIPNSAQSDFALLDDYSAVIFNSSGIYKIDTRTAVPLAYRINTPVPNIAIASNVQTSSTPYCARYLYNAARIAENDNLRTRLSPARVDSETGTVAIDDRGQDYGEIWTEDPIGPGSYTYGKLICAPLSGSYANASGWAAISPSIATFRINLNGEGFKEVYSDFTDVSTMTEVAAVIQASMRDYWAEAECLFVGGDHFELSSGRIQNGTISVATAGTTGTDIATHMGATEASGGRVIAPTINAPNVVGPLWVPAVADTNPQEYQWHHTHFPIWRTLNTQGAYNGKRHNEHRYIWVHDLRTCGAFYVRRQAGVITALVGEFEEADKGSVLEYTNGDRDEILEVIDSTRVRYAYAADYYYDAPATMAAALGNGRVFKASQSGNLVTIHDGDSIFASDVRKPFHWAIGYCSYIREYVSPTQFRVWDTMDKVVQGATMDPTHRYFCDTVPDETLRTRQTTLLLRQRFFRALPNANCGQVVPGFLLSAVRGDGRISYSQILQDKEYMIGYHNPDIQIDTTIKDDIQAIYVFPDKTVIWTSGKTYHVPSNVPTYVTLPEVGEVVVQLPGVDVLSESIGCYDRGSVQAVGNGEVILITSEPGGVGLRRFNGHSYGPNMLDYKGGGLGRYRRAMQLLQQATASLYDGNTGYLVWGIDSVGSVSEDGQPVEVNFEP